ncbi:MAG TPA: substrate-binding domain-containing protein [Spirochaetales bacterium]|nr:substrate-binding domain-containing protein [Spirochaetales bacterium]HRY54989.1 substrate-binding domain-containing protein [Spirochaetia bacterium]
MKRFLSVVLVLALASTVVFAAGNKKPLIGVSIWSSTDTLGSQCKRILDAAAKALDVNLMYIDQGHVSEKVTASAETLAAAGCDGMIICNSASAEMNAVINTCTKNKMYLAQFFRIIDKTANPNEYKLACQSPYFIGAVHESEVDNGMNLVRILCEKGCRKIALEGWNSGDATFLLRWQGYKKGIEAWNKANPKSKAVLLDPQYGGTTTDTGRATAEAIINANKDIDALIVAGGGGDTLIGALAAIDSMGLKGKIKVMSTDFLADLDQQLASGAMAGESGGHYADPLFAFMLVYNAVKGNYKKPAGSFYEIIFPYLYVASPADYEAYAKYFVDDLPYNASELVAMSKLSEPDLAKKSAALSIQDVMQRRK